MRRLIALGLLAALTASPVALPAQTAVTSGPVSEVARREVAQGNAPGVVIAWGRAGEAPRIAAAGRIAAQADAPAVGADSLWRVYSMTKPITGVAAMILVEEGKLGLDQPIADFLPAFREMKVLVDPAKDLESRPAARPITVRHLLTHTAGLGYTIAMRGPLLGEYNRLGLIPFAVNEGFEAQARRMRPQSLRAFADRVATLPLIADPGTRWSYSIGLDVLGAVIEVASGMAFDRFVQARIFDPLGMKSSYWTVPASEAGRLATSYALFGETRVPADPGATSIWLRPPGFPYGGAGLVMSARDYDRFLAMLLGAGTLDGVRILKPETVRLAMSDLLPPGVDKQLLGAAPGVTAPMGFGAGGSVTLAATPNGPGRGAFGWPGAAGTGALVDPERGVRATIMVNVMSGSSLRGDAVRALYADLAR